MKRSGYKNRHGENVKVYGFSLQEKYHTLILKEADRQEVSMSLLVENLVAQALEKKEP
jgi:hypothetical protein